MGIGRILAIIAAFIFVLASVDAWPNVASEFEPIALGLAFLAAAHAL